MNNLIISAPLDPSYKAGLAGALPVKESTLNFYAGQNLSEIRNYFFLVIYILIL
jgi:hypothetical protein